MAENLDAISLNVFMFQVSNLCLRDWLTMASATVIRLLEVIKFVLITRDPSLKV